MEFLVKCLGNPKAEKHIRVQLAAAAVDSVATMCALCIDIQVAGDARVAAASIAAKRTYVPFSTNDDFSDTGNLGQ